MLHPTHRAVSSLEKLCASLIWLIRFMGLVIQDVYNSKMSLHFDVEISETFNHYYITLKISHNPSLKITLKLVPQPRCFSQNLSIPMLWFWVRNQWNVNNNETVSRSLIKFGNWLEGEETCLSIMSLRDGIWLRSSSMRWVSWMWIKCYRCTVDETSNLINQILFGRLIAWLLIKLLDRTC